MNRKAKVKWFLIGLGVGWLSLILPVAWMFAFGPSYSYNSFGQTETCIVPLSDDGLMMHIYEPTNHYHDIRFGPPGHILTWLRPDGTWTNRVIPIGFSPFDELVFASSSDRQRFWLIDSLEGNWAEWDISEDALRLVTDEPAPEYEWQNKYLTVK
jgi:hypothetical protein